MARREQQKVRPRKERERLEHMPLESGESGGSKEQGSRAKAAAKAKQARPGRTIGDMATSYSSVGGAEEPAEWSERLPGVVEDNPESVTGPVHDVSFRPAPGGYIETEGHRGRDVPYTGEVASTRGSTFEEDPDTGHTADEEEGEYIRESLEERTRGYESG